MRRDLLSVRHRALLVLKDTGRHVNDLLEARGCAIEALDLMENILAIVVGHLHAAVVVGERRVRHLECLHRDGADTAQISLIALTLEDCFLSELDAVFLFEFTNHIFKELQLVLHLDDFGLNLNDDLLLHLALEHAVAGHVREQLDSSHTSSSSTGLQEVLAVLHLARVTCYLRDILLQGLEDNLELPLGSPLLDERIIDVFDAIVLTVLLAHLDVQLLVLLVELRQLLALLKLELFDALVEARRILQLDHLHLLHDLFLEVLVGLRYMLVELLERGTHVHREGGRALLQETSAD